MADRDIAEKPASYQSDIAHLLPAELTAFYIGVKGIIPSVGRNFDESLTYLYVLVGFAVMLASIFYFIMPQMLNISGRSQRILYCTTFLVWVLGIEIDHLFTLLQAQDTDNASNIITPNVIRVVINLFVAVWSFGVPFLFRKINPSPA